MVSGYAHDPTALALEGWISKMESKMDEIHAMFAAFIKSATPNPPTIVVSPTKTVDARAIEVQDNQQVDQEAREKVCDAYVSKMCDAYVMLCLYMLWNFLVRCFPFKVLNFHNLFIFFNNLFCKLISCMARNEHTTLIKICAI